MLLISLLLAGAGLVLLTQYIDDSTPLSNNEPTPLSNSSAQPESQHHQPKPSLLGLYVSASLLGAAFGATNAYATTLWAYLYGDADVIRIRQTSIAITLATSGSAIFIFALSRDAVGSYGPALRVSAIVAFTVAALDLMLLTKPEVLEAVVRRAPMWEQLVAWRQRMMYVSPLGRWVECFHAWRRRAGVEPMPTTRPNQANPIEPMQQNF